MKIMPMVSSGVVLMHEDGSFEMAPLQVFRSATGQTVIRLGNNALFFKEDGSFDGNECKIPGGGVPVEQAAALQGAFHEQGKNTGKAPAEAYFQEGSRGWDREVAGWPKPTN